MASKQIKSIKPNQLGHHLNLRLSLLVRLMSIRDLGQPWSGIRRLVMLFYAQLAEWFFTLTAKYIVMANKIIAIHRLLPMAN